VWVPRKSQDPRDPRQIPEEERYYFLEERYPAYGNLVPRDIATREIFDICVNEGLSVDEARQCVYLDLTHIDRAELDRKLGGILEIYEKFQGVDPRDTPMKIFPAVHYSMGGLWADYERTAEGGLVIGSPTNQLTNIPHLYAIGECDYQFHGGNRLGANSLLSCIFSGLIVAPGVQTLFESDSGKTAGEMDGSFYERETKRYQEQYETLLKRPSDGENPYKIHEDLGEVMTRTATVVRYNNQLSEAYERVCELEQRSQNCSLSDTGNWTNQNAVFTRALLDMFPLAKAILKGALTRDECRGAHYKPDFAMKSLTAEEPSERRKQAEQWCDQFAETNRKWLKSTIASCQVGDPDLQYEDVDTSLIPPRPRLYGLAGAELIEEVWNERQKSRAGGDDP
jgi:succinate dehydrogenase / fumarate reductase flavoprotein subunit